MADYKDIVGSKVTVVTTNPTNPSDGQVWYNTTDNVLRYRNPASTAAWAAGGNLNSGRGAHSAAGTQTASLAFGGLRSDTCQSTNESYNGTSWTEVGDLNAARAVGGSAGTQTAALYFNGEMPASPYIFTGNESWNGSAWTEITDANTARRFATGAGKQTSALSIGGDTPVGVAITESWNGSSWTEVGDLNTARGAGTAAGADNTAALLFAGGPPPKPNPAVCVPAPAKNLLAVFKAPPDAHVAATTPLSYLNTLSVVLYQT